MARLLHNVLTKEGKDTHVTLIMDFSKPGQSSLPNLMATTGLAVTVLHINWLTTHQEQHRSKLTCPSLRQGINMTDIGRIVHVKQNRIYKRKPLLAMSPSTALTIVVWVSKEKTFEATSIFENDVVRCKQRLDMGLLNKDNKVIFVSEDKNNTLDIFKANSFLSHHPKVAVMHVVNRHNLVWNKDFYLEADQEGIILNGIQSLDRDLQITKNIFHKQRTFHEKKRLIRGIPIAHYTQATHVENPISKHQLYTNRWGIAIDMLEVMQEKLNFKVKFWNPDPPFDFGKFADDGSWTGGMGMLYGGTCDIILDWGSGLERTQVSSLIPYNYVDYETFVSPLPRPVSNTWAIMLPFQNLVWISVTISVPAMSIFHYLLAHLEGILKTTLIKPWMSFGGSLWYSFGTL